MGRPYRGLHDPRSLHELDIVQGGPSLEETIRSGANQGFSTTVARGQVQSVANFRNAYSDESMLISLMRDDGSNPPGTGEDGIVDADVFARISYGAGACTEIVDVDWLSGTTLHVPGSNANVAAVYPSDPLTDSGSVGDWNVRVGAMCTRGRKSAEGPTGTARRTIRLGFIANSDASQLIAIPNRALSVQVAACNFDGAGVFENTRIDFSSAVTTSPRTGSDLLRTRAGNAGAYIPGDIVLPNGARSFRVFNFTGDDIRYTAIFTLAL